MTRRLTCAACGSETDWIQPTWRCSCGGLWDLEPPLPGAGLSRSVLQLRPGSLWRFRESFPFPASWTGWRALTLGEGGTALVPVDPSRPGLQAKVELASPTLSFKDRGAVMVVARAVMSGASGVVLDSSGNAGTAVAAYAARAGLPCRVFVPSTTSSAKLAQMAAHGASVVPIAGDRAAVAAAAEVEASATDAFYASHVWDPFFLEGTKTYAFEVWEQLGHQAPDVVVVPAGNGTLVLGCHLGFGELLAAGLIDRRPQILAAQSSACPPLARAWADGLDRPVRVDPRPTVAEGIAIAAPPRGAQVLAAVRASDGEIVTVTDAELDVARAELAARGLFVEPTGAVTWAATTKAQFPEGVSVVLPLCGAGLKSPA